MSRYFSRPFAHKLKADLDWWNDQPLTRDLSVSDHEAVDTGLIDSAGNTIWRAPNPMGFGRSEEWS